MTKHGAKKGVVSARPSPVVSTFGDQLPQGPDAPARDSRQMGTGKAVVSATPKAAKPENAAQNTERVLPESPPPFPPRPPHHGKR